MWRFDATARAPPCEDTGSGAEATIVVAIPLVGRSTTIRGCALPPMRLAYALAETSTPSSGDSTSAPPSASCQRPTSALGQLTLAHQ